MELSAKDKKILFGGRCWLFTFFRKRRALKKIDELINEADQLLVTYPPVNYNNFGVMINPDSLQASLFAWNRKINEFFKDVFEDKESDIQMKFVFIVGDNTYGEYLMLRNTLVKKRDFLVDFQKVLAAL